MLFSYPVLDRASYSLNDYFKGAVHDLDEAARDHMSIIYVGDPGVCGRFHDNLRSKQLRESDARDSIDYVENIYKTGREQHHRLGEMKELQRKLGLSPSDLPCMVFCSRLGRRPVGVLRVRPSWYASAPAVNTFDSHFRAWLDREDLEWLATASLSESELSAQLEASLAALTVEIDAAIAVPGATVESPRQAVGNAFQWDGEQWRITWDGTGLPRLPDLAGLRVLHFLLEHPDKEFPVLDLVAQTLDKDKRTVMARSHHVDDNARWREDGGISVQGGIDSSLPKSDTKSRDSLLKELERLRDIKEIEEERGGQASEKTLEDIRLIASQHLSDFGPDGQPRRLATSRHTARVRVNKDLETAYRRLHKHCPELRQHLANSVSSGMAVYAYRPGVNLGWELQPPTGPSLGSRPPCGEIETRSYD